MGLSQPYITDIFVEIGAVRRIRDAISYAMVSPYPSYIVSDPGHGKTTALFHLAKEFNGSYGQIGEAHKNISGMYLALLSASGVLAGSQYERELFNQVIYSISPHRFAVPTERKLIIIDEFQTLEDRTKRELLKVQETCGFALVLGGNSERIISSGKKDVKALQQIEDRIGMRVALPALDGRDCVEIGAAYGVEGMDAYKAISAFGTQTNVRALVRLLQYAKRLAGGTAAIHIHHLKSAVPALYGKADALKLLMQDDA
ncbi:AAA family ATPase [Rhizobium sp. FY34]|uniref:AAA family ATPase n=1 Tax=Rhizobium sp. FY34 TaxID=2562309 RepID=UPI0032B2C266